MHETVFVLGEDYDLLHAVLEEKTHGLAGDLGAVELDDVEIVVVAVGVEEGVDRGDALEAAMQAGAHFGFFRFAADDRAVAVLGIQAFRDRAVLADDAELHGDVEFLKLLEHGGDELRGGAPVEILFDGRDRIDDDHDAEMADADAVRRARALASGALAVAELLDDGVDLVGGRGFDEFAVVEEPRDGGDVDPCAIGNVFQGSHG